MKIKGFTLAEVLLTLTIVGVIASFTIPALINNINDSSNKVAWKKAYADIAQVTLRVAQDNGGSIENICSDVSADGQNCFKNKYFKYLNYIKECNVG